MAEDLGKTSTGIEPKVAALLCYVVGFVSGLVFFLIEKDNKFVRFHAMQSMMVFGGFFVLQMALSVIPGLVMLVPLIGLASIVIWILCMVKAFQGETFKLPVVGDLAAQQVR